LTAWGVTQTKTKYKAAVIGAGVTNWEGLVMESSSPELEVSGLSLCVCVCVQTTDMSARQPSVVHHLGLCNPQIRSLH